MTVADEHIFIAVEVEVEIIGVGRMPRIFPPSLVLWVKVEALDTALPGEDEPTILDPPWIKPRTACVSIIVEAQEHIANRIIVEVGEHGDVGRTRSTDPVVVDKFDGSYIQLGEGAVSQPA